MDSQNNIASRLMSDIQRDYGLSTPQAAGVVGNLMHESGEFQSLQERNPVVSGSRGGYGYAQWTGPRRRAFEAYVQANGLDPTSYEANYGFLQHELANDPYERRQFDTVRKAQTAEEAARLISQNYLRPGIPHMDSRVNYANQLLGYAPAATNAPNPAPPLMRNAAAPKGGSFFSPLSGLLANVQLPQVNMPEITPQMKQGALAPLLGSVAGRTALWNAIMPSNIGAAPSITQGFRPGGTLAMQVSQGGSVPVTLMRSDSAPSRAFDAAVHSNQNMDVYRANRDVVNGPINQGSIDRAMSEGKKLVRQV